MIPILRLLSIVVTILAANALAQNQSSGELDEPIERNWQNVFVLVPYFESSRIVGFRLLPNRDRKEFLSLGLMPGDLLIRINGEPVQNPESGVHLVELLNGGKSVEVTILGGRDFTENELTLN